MSDVKHIDLPADFPRSVLFVCYLNSIRSPMAEGLLKQQLGTRIFIQSCGLEDGEIDDLMVSVMAEKNIDMSGHVSKRLSNLSDTSFDLVIAFTDDAAAAAQSFFSDTDTVVEHWPMPNPTAGSLDVRAMMNNYRSVRDAINARLKRKFTL